MFTLSNYFYLSLLVLTLQYELKKVEMEFKEKLPETFDRGEGPHRRRLHLHSVGYFQDGTQVRCTLSMIGITKCPL